MNMVWWLNVNYYVANVIVVLLLNWTSRRGNLDYIYFAGTYVAAALNIQLLFAVLGWCNRAVCCKKRDYS